MTEVEPLPESQSLEPEFAILVARWRGPLVGMLRAWGVVDAVELAQDVLAEAWLGRARFTGSWEDDTRVGPWLRGIARNVNATATRKRSRGPIRADVDVDRVVAPRTEQDASSERGAVVRSAIARLPDKLRAPIWMHYLERTPVRRVAALLGVREKTVEGRLYRARRELARMPADQGLGRTRR